MTTWFDVPEQSGRFHLIEVPFAATSSFRRVAHEGPTAMRAASAQIDLHTIDGRCPAEAGIDAERLPAEALHRRAAEAMDGLRRGRGDQAPVIAACAAVEEQLRGAVQGTLQRGQQPLVLGGDHGSIFGGLAAAAEAHPGLGILHIDAHADLRVAYEGIPQSHASVMHRAVSELGLAALVQVGLRDLCAEELARIAASPTIHSHFAETLATERFAGRFWKDQVDEMIGALPAEVWISLDIDGLEPHLCPNTGTPVPGGLSWDMTCALIDAVGRSGRRVVGADLNEVAPQAEDAIVGSRMAYRLLAAML